MDDLKTRQHILISMDSSLNFLTTGEIEKIYEVEILESGNVPNHYYGLDTEPKGYHAGLKVRRDVGFIDLLMKAAKDPFAYSE